MLLLATLVGCNYARTEYDLLGCINDVDHMRNELINRFGFAADDITTLTDDNPAALPTGAKIKKAVKDMVKRAREEPQGGAHLFFHFSGHGTLVSGGPYDGQEAIVPCDLNLITDQDFRLLLRDLPDFTIFTAVMDSCRCGGPRCLHVHGTDPEQIVPTAAPPPRTPASNCRIRFIPLETVMQQLAARLRACSTDPRQLKNYMVSCFGDNASALFGHVEVPAGRPPDYVVLLTACQKYEHAAERSGDSAGAFTSALLAALQEHQVITNLEIVSRASELLEEWGYRSQKPRYYIINTMLDAPFLCSQWPL